ncbi:MAG: hypothetical protein JNK67_12520 [Alphaproteobacteria bacterium]|nr:hypothetical protein [Alphaproteobacteria bacterium]
MNAVVFLGPSLARAEAEARLAATWLPPARRGDIYRAVRALRPAAILLIDGRFHDTAAVWHREILWALREGVHVLGAASMGALRAAELARFGMRGIGRIFEAYRDARFEPYGDRFDDDGEVAVVHAPPELGSAPLSIALVDLRHALAEAWSAGRLAQEERDGVLAEAAALPYAERSVERVAEILAARISDAPARERLAARIADPGAGLKAADARAALETLARLLAASPPPFSADFTLEPALVWERFRETMERAVTAPVSAIESAVLDELRGDPAAWRALRLRAAQRLAALRPARDPRPHEDARRRSLAALQRRHGLHDRAKIEDWIARNALTPDGFTALVDREAVLDAAADADPDALAVAMLEILRLDGAFESLARRARAHAGDSTQGPAPHRAARETALLAAFLDRHPDLGTRRRDVAALVRLLDCRDEAHLFAVLARAATAPEMAR